MKKREWEAMTPKQRTAYNRKQWLKLENWTLFFVYSMGFLALIKIVREKPWYYDISAVFLYIALIGILIIMKVIGHIDKAKGISKDTSAFGDLIFSKQEREQEEAEPTHQERKQKMEEEIEILDLEQEKTTKVEEMKTAEVKAETERIKAQKDGIEDIIEVEELLRTQKPKQPPQPAKSPEEREREIVQQIVDGIILRAGSVQEALAALNKAVEGIENEELRQKVFNIGMAQVIELAQKELPKK